MDHLNSCFSSLLLFLQTIIQYKLALSNETVVKFRNLIHFGYKYIYTTERCGKFANIMDKRANDLIKNTVRLFLVILIVAFLFIIYPLYLFLSKGERPWPVPIIVPFVDPDTDLGYFLCIGNQTIIGTTGILGLTSLEVLVLIMLNNLWTASDNIRYSLDELASNVRKGATITVRRAQLRNILMQIHDLDQ